MLSQYDWLWGPFEYLAIANKRIFLPFLICSLLMVIIRGVLSRHASIKHDFGQLFSWKIWSHPSSRVDFMCLFFNNWLSVLILAPLIWNVEEVVLWSADVLNHLLNNRGMFYHWPQWVVTLSYTLAIFIFQDLSRFLLHYALHRIPFLWRFHRVHHSAEVITPVTLYRAHPVEMTLYRLRSLLVIGLVSGVFFYLFMGKMRPWDILGVNSLGFLFNLLGANLRHSQVWMGFGPLERIFISPAQHQMHHSREMGLARSNIGSCLAIWDQLLGTWKKSSEVPKGERDNYGVTPERNNHNPQSWASTVWSPFVKS